MAKGQSEASAPISEVNELVATGGGPKSKVWLQIIADVLGTQLRLPVLEEGAAYGASSYGDAATP